MNVSDYIKDFKKLSFDQKKEKILKILEPIKTTHEVFANFFKIVQSSTQISEEILTLIYQGIIEVVQEIKLGHNQQAQAKIKKMTNILTQIKHKEQLEKEREGNPDLLLTDL